MDKGTQYHDLSKAAQKKAKQLKLNLQKYEIVKSEENILVSKDLEGVKSQDERVVKVC